MAKNLMTNNTYDARAAGLLNPAVSIEWHEDKCLEFFEPIGLLESPFIEAHKVLNMTCTVRSFKL